MRIRTDSIFAIVLLCALVFQEAMAQESEPLRRRTSPPSETALVKKALAGFIYGIQHNMPDIARGYYAPDKVLHISSDAEKSDEVCSAAIRAMKSLGNDPIVMIANSRITFQDGKAIADCHLIWRFQNGNGEVIRLTGKERFALVKNGSDYTIIESKLASEVLTHWNSKKSLENALRGSRAPEDARD